MGSRARRRAKSRRARRPQPRHRTWQGAPPKFGSTRQRRCRRGGGGRTAATAPRESASLPPSPLTAEFPPRGAQASSWRASSPGPKTCQMSARWSVAMSLSSVPVVGETLLKPKEQMVNHARLLAWLDSRRLSDDTPPAGQPSPPAGHRRGRAARDPSTPLRSRRLRGTGSTAEDADDAW